MTPFKARAIANVLGITERQVDNLVKANVLPKIGRGKFELVATVRAYIAHIRSGKAAEKLDALREQEIALKRSQVRKNELEIAHLSGKSIAVEDAQRIWERVVIAAKTNVMLVENETQRIRDAKTITEAKELHKKALADALTELSQAHIDIPEASFNEGGDADDAALAPAAGPHDQPMGRKQHVAKPRGQQRSRKVSH